MFNFNKVEKTFSIVINKKYRNDANFIIIAHKDGTFAQYVHLKKNGVLVSKNDTVKKEQVIDYSGNTGMSTEPHLHFAVYKPTKNGLVSIPYILNFIPTKRYKKGKFAFYNWNKIERTTRGTVYE